MIRKLLIVVGLTASLSACCKTALQVPLRPAQIADREVLDVPMREDAMVVAGVLPSSPAPVDRPPGAEVNVNLSATSGGGSFQSNLINGLTDFVLGRAKQEVVDFLAKTLGDKLCDDQSAWDVSSYFPATCGLMEALSADAEALSVQKIGGMFRSSLEEDLRGLFPVLLNAAAEIVVPAKYDSYRQLVPLVVDIGTGIRRGDNPLALLVSVLEGLPCDAADNTFCGLRSVAVVSRVLVVSDLDWWTTTDATSEAGKSAIAQLTVEVTSLLEDPALKQVKTWIDARVESVESLVQTVWKAATLLDQATTWGTSLDEQPVGAVLELTIELAADVFETIEDKKTAAFLRTAAQLWRQRETWVAAGRGLLAVTVALWNGARNPLDIIENAGALFPCDDNSELGCAVQMASLVVRKIVDEAKDLAARAEEDWDTWRDAAEREASAAWDAQSWETGTWDAAPVFDWSGEIAPSLTITHDALRDSVESLAGQARKLATGLETLVETESAAVKRFFKRHLLAAEDQVAYVRRLVESVRATTRLAAELDGLALDKEIRPQVEAALYAATLEVLSVAVELALPEDTQRRFREIAQALVAARAALATRDFSAFLTQLFTVARATELDKALPESVRKYAPLVTDLLSARSAKEVSTVLERHAAPIGSWRRKRGQRWLGSIASLVGGMAGREWTTMGTSDEQVAGNELALFVPVGLDITWGARGCWSEDDKNWCPWPTGFFLSVADLGTLTAFRLKEGDEDAGVEAPNTSFLQVFSPGIFARWSPFESPFVFGGGCSVVPGLRGSESDDAELTFRVTAFIGVDVNILTL